MEGKDPGPHREKGEGDGLSLKQLIAAKDETQKACSDQEGESEAAVREKRLPKCSIFFVFSSPLIHLLVPLTHSVFDLSMAQSHQTDRFYILYSLFH